jgi:hypothetical protein
MQHFYSVRDAYNSAEGVFIGTVTKVKDVVKTHTGQSLFGWGNKEVVFNVTEWEMYIQIEKTYKGASQNEIILAADGTSCATKFDVGSRLLLYVTYDKEHRVWRIDSLDKEHSVWRIDLCNRSRILIPANDDISFLEGLPKNLERTRISGHLNRLKPDGVSSETQPLAGIKIKIAGHRKTHVLTTDKNGFYELYNLPVDKYTITPEVPKGLKVWFPSNFPTFFKEGKNSIKVNLKDNKCIGFDFDFITDE